mmetsp:Transcript_13237/g.48214  ORF Transcript_13237/g.48214 Transcript_13237/m.48214 type:complete len:83 (-) Transcript_13237:57-305(-)|eukprot:scaffold2200_cov413-Prasinococcus_capsulatus_cf.AAC.7
MRHRVLRSQPSVPYINRFTCAKSTLFYRFENACMKFPLAGAACVQLLRLRQALSVGRSSKVDDAAFAAGVQAPAQHAEQERR